MIILLLLGLGDYGKMKLTKKNQNQIRNRLADQIDKNRISNPTGRKALCGVKKGG